MKILYVEDENILREEVSIILEFEGYDVQVAEDGLKGLEMIEVFQPDLVITDMKMPNMSGEEMLNEIRNSKKNTIPVVILSAFAMTDWINRIKSLGATQYLTKPFSIDELLQTIENSLQQNHSQN